MIRLLRIEFLKIRAYKTFWAILLIYALLIVLVSYTTNKSAEATSQGSLFSFPMIWFNLVQMASFFNFLPGVLIILLICNEYTFRTFRQNVVDGLSRDQVVMAKFAFIKAIAFCCILFLFTYGMVRGLAMGHFDHLGDIFSEINFLLRLFVQMVGYMGIAALLAFIIKKAALAIIAFFLTIILEYLVRSQIPDEIERFLPMHVLNHLIFDNARLNSLQGLSFSEAPPLSLTVLVLLAIGYFLLCLTFSRLLMQRSAL